MRNKRTIIFLILALAFSLRLYHLGYRDFWYDEAATALSLRYPWHNWNAPLYFILLHFWSGLFGISEFSLRLPSLIFSFLSVVLVFFMASELFNKKTAIFASLIMGLSPFQIWYAQEARDYSMLLFLGLLSTWLFYKCLKEGRVGLWLFFILASIVGLYTSYFYIFLLLGQCLYLLALRRLKITFQEVSVFLIIFASFLVYLSKFLSKFYYVKGGFWLPRPQAGTLLVTLENFTLGYSGLPGLYIMSDALVGISLVSFFWNIRRHEWRQNAVFCLFFFCLPVICAFLFSKIIFPVYIDRGLIISSPFFYIMLSLGIVSLSRKVKTIVLVPFFALLILSACGYFGDLFRPSPGVLPKKPIKPVVEFLEQSIKPDDIIAFTNLSPMPSCQFYSQGKLPYPYFFFDPKFPNTDWQRPFSAGRYFIPVQRIGQLAFSKIWLIASDWKRSGELDENCQSVKEWLDGRFRLESASEFSGLWVFQYGKR